MSEPRLWGLLAEFDSHEALVTAARRARAAGYRRLDAYSPYPVDELHDALGLRATRIALVVLVGGLLGAAGGYVLQFYLMAVDYPLNIGGRPLHSWPAFVPVTFELMVLTASIVAVVALFARNGFPSLHHPLFGVPGFARATQDRFFLSVEASDPQFAVNRTRRFLLQSGSPLVVDVPDV